METFASPTIRETVSVTRFNLTHDIKKNSFVSLEDGKRETIRMISRHDTRSRIWKREIGRKIISRKRKNRNEIRNESESQEKSTSAEGKEIVAPGRRSMN